ncbi:MAG: sigma 54-dependent Fis family transcriptional regulator [Kofleriaceae bacterium]|nr:sigma 54-dependent Fis family transcriptional regulator [Kofleriaceae bacterium]
MAFARLVVIAGPDLGREFDVPMRGGSIGRDGAGLVVLTDPAVSRLHCHLELREEAMWLVDDSGKGRTLVNGAPITIHRLQTGDELVLGTTRLSFLGGDGDGARASRPGAGKVTMEVSSRQLMALVHGRGDDRAQRTLAAIAEFGDRLRADSTAGPSVVARAACELALTALGAQRAFVLVGASGRLGPLAGALAAGEPAGAPVAPARDLVDKVVRDGKALTVTLGGRATIMVPLPGAGDEPGVFYVDRTGGGRDWDDLDAMTAACLANLVGAAVIGADTRDQLARGKAALEERLSDGEFIGRSPAAQRIMDFVARVGPSDATVLLGGESGSGKEMVARAIHRASRRARGPCVAVNCAALTETLIESELFGHEKGAFTGATDRKLGRFELADRGTLFLDEVGELPLGLQTKFLRVLEERRFERVGGGKAIDVDVRVVAASNRDLADMARRGTFREDLYYRLSVIHTVVPPLRDRPDDVLLLADFFLARFRQQAGRRITGFHADAQRALAAHRWPGNVRELRNAVERAVVLGDGDLIRAEDLPPNIAAPPPRRSSPTPPMGSMAIVAAPSAPTPASGGPSDGGPFIVAPAAAPTAPGTGPGPARSLKDLERDGIIAALAATGGNKAQAAAILEIDRSTLYKKLKDYGIEA